MHSNTWMFPWINGERPLARIEETLRMKFTISSHFSAMPMKIQQIKELILIPKRIGLQPLERNTTIHFFFKICNCIGLQLLADLVVSRALKKYFSGSEMNTVYSDSFSLGISHSISFDWLGGNRRRDIAKFTTACYI